MDIYNAAVYSVHEKLLRQKVAVGPEGTTCKEETVDGEKIPAGSPCYIMGFDKDMGTFKGILKPRNKER